MSFPFPFEVWEWSWSAGWVAKRILVFLSNAWVNMIWLTSPQPYFSLFQPLASLAALPSRTDLWSLAKAVTKKPQRGEVKWGVSLVRKSDLLTQSMALSVASCCLEHLWDYFWWCHGGLLYLLPHGAATLSISGQPREMAEEMMARGIYWLDRHISWTLTFSCVGHAYCKESQGFQFFTTCSHFSFNLTSSLLFILCPYTASGCLWTD